MNPAASTKLSRRALLGIVIVSQRVRGRRLAQNLDRLRSVAFCDDPADVFDCHFCRNFAGTVTNASQAFAAGGLDMRLALSGSELGHADSIGAVPRAGRARCARG